MSLDGQVYWPAHPPGVRYPSDANEVSPGRYIVADYSYPGQVVIFSRTAQLVWRFRPAGAAALNHPSLALPLPNGNILVNDDYNDRVIVITRQTNRIVWQYGHDGVPGRAAGYLDNPDGVDLAPPDSLLMTHPATTGPPWPPGRCAQRTGRPAEQNGPGRQAPATRSRPRPPAAGTAGSEARTNGQFAASQPSSDVMLAKQTPRSMHPIFVLYPRSHSYRRPIYAPDRDCAHSRQPSLWSLNVMLDSGVDVLSSRILLRPSDLDRSRRLYRDLLGLAVYREFGRRAIPGWCSSSARGCWRSPGARPARPGAR